MTDEAPSDQVSTTTSQKRSIYDQLIVSKGSYQEFGYNDNIEAELGKNVGVVAFDQSSLYDWATAQWSDATKILSDHRPIWIQLLIGVDDD